MCGAVARSPARSSGERDLANEKPERWPKHRLTMAVMRVALLLMLVGCEWVAEEVSEEFLPDHSTELVMKKRLVFGETGTAYFADACTTSDHPTECTDNEWTITSHTCSGAALRCYSAPYGLSYTADTKRSSGTISIAGTSEGGRYTSSQSGSFEALPPEEAVVVAACANSPSAAPPYLIPAAKETLLAWRLMLDGTQRPTGDTGQVLVDAPGFTTVTKFNGIARATATSPATTGVATVRSTLGDSTFDYTVYAPDELTALDLTLKTTGTNVLSSSLVGRVGAVATCTDPRKQVQSLTPSICLLQINGGKVSEASESVEIILEDTLFIVVGAAGTCRLRATVDGTALEQFFDIEVEAP